MKNLLSPQKCMEIWLLQKPVRSGKTLWYSIARCIECAVNQDETARELSRIRTDIAKHDEEVRAKAIDEFANALINGGLDLYADEIRDIRKIAERIKWGAE